MQKLCNAKVMVKIMKKKIISAILSALLCLTAVLTSCGKDSSTPMGFKEISDPSLTYHLYVPNDWTADLSTGITSAYYNGRDPSNISMTAFELDTAVTGLESFWELYEKDLITVFPDIEYESSGSCTLDGVDAMEYIYTATVSGIKYKFMQVIAIKNNTAFIFTYTAVYEKYDEHIEDVLAILEYFDFK